MPTKTPTPALAAFAGADFRGALGLRDVWADPPFPVDACNGDLADRILAEFLARTRAPRASPSGLVLSGRSGSGKTHLLAALRRRVSEGGGWFVCIDVFGVADFWRTAAFAFVESLSRRTPRGSTQAGAVLLAVLRAISGDAAALQAAAKAKPRLAQAGAVELMLAMLAAREPNEALRHQDVVRALALLESREASSRDFAAMWLQGCGGDEKQRRELGFLGEPPAPVEIVRGLMWIMGQGGPTLIVVEGIDAILGETKAKGETAAGALLHTVAVGLVELHDVKRRALTLVSCLEPTWAILKACAFALAAERFRELPALAPVASAAIVERLIASRLAPAHASAGFAPPNPTYPFARAAIASGVGLTPRAILQRCLEHQDACVALGDIRECESLAGSAPPAAAGSAGTEALDETFATARARAEPIDLHDEAAVAAQLDAACRLYLRQLSLPRSIDGWSIPAAIAPIPALHARLAFVFHDSDGRQASFGLRVIADDEARAFQARLKAAMIASGIEAGLPLRKLVILRAGAPPKTDLVARFLDAGGLFLAPEAEDFAVIAALCRLETLPGFEAWLRRRKPLFETRLFQACGLAPPEFLDAARPASAPPSPITASPAPPPSIASPAPPPSIASPPGAPPSVSALTAHATREPPARAEIIVGRSLQIDEVFGPVALPTALLPRHVAVFAGSGAGKSVFLSRLVEEAAILGAPALVLDLNNDLSRLGEPWPSRPTDFSDEDARKAKLYFERVEVVLWTPGLGGGRPMSMRALPDFAALGRGGDPESLDERERAVEMALATLETYLPNCGAKAIKLRAALANALRAFARAGGGSFDDLLRLLLDLPTTASRNADAPALAREIAHELIAAVAINPLLSPQEPPLDPALLFSGETRKTRVSVVNLSGLGDEAERAAFVNQLQMTLFFWIKRHPSPTGRLYVLDEAHLFAPAKETTPVKRSALALIKQGRKYGLGMVFATREPRSLDPAIAANCMTHVYGAVDSPASREAVAAMMAARGVAAEEVRRLGTGEFYFAAEGMARPIKIRAPLCLSRRTPNPPTTAEVAARRP
jgi:hypothetical protein